VTSEPGAHFNFQKLRQEPLPVQSRLPIMIGGSGERKTLRTVAKHADMWNAMGTPEFLAHKVEVLERHCAELGTDFRGIVRSANYNCVIASSEAEVDERLRAVEERARPYLGEEGAARFVGEYRSPNALAVGTPEQVVERLRGMAERGLGYTIVYFPEAAYDRSGIDLFEREVVPALAG
jgi:alkanesulfonate monooxygenase SsuD/methylene tetrahydromethanopterin reductase-like flavin-dependent oxidoreductase (luciferase family)